MSDPPISTAAIVCVVDDDAAARTLVCQTLEAAGIAAAAFSSAEDFLARADLAKASCVVTDVHMDGMTGVELQEQLSRASAALPVIVITGFATASLAVRAMRQGAAAFLQKPYSADQMIASVREAITQNAIARERLARREELAGLFAQFETAELEVLEKLAEGLSSKELARELDVSLRTIEARRNHIFKTLGVSSAAEAVKLHLEFKGA